MDSVSYVGLKQCLDLPKTAASSSFVKPTAAALETLRASEPEGVSFSTNIAAKFLSEIDQDDKTNSRSTLIKRKTGNPKPWIIPGPPA